MTVLAATDSRSGEMSIMWSEPAWAPPMPLPQTTVSPTMAATCMAAAIVRTPSAFFASRMGMSLMEALSIVPLFFSR